MGSKTFQMRACQNPACGLRYPWYEGQQHKERCPHCLGATQSVLESELPGETDYTGAARRDSPKLEVLLDNIRSAWNAGSILRTSEGFGFAHAYLCGITPSPERPQVHKTALGAEKSVAWSVHKDALLLARRLQTEGRYILALEARPGAVPLAQFHPRESSGHPILLMAGNEVSGLDPALIEIADKVVCLPMKGKKRSVNVAVAFVAAAYSISSSTND